MLIHRDLAFDVPAGWHPSAVAAFGTPEDEDRHRCEIRIQRADRHKPHDPLAEYVEQLSARLKKDGVLVHSCEPADKVDGRETYLLRLGWRGRLAYLEQTTFVVLSRKGEQATQFSCAEPRHRAGAALGAFDALVKSVRFLREPDGPQNVVQSDLTYDPPPAPWVDRSTIGLFLRGEPLMSLRIDLGVFPEADKLRSLRFLRVSHYRAAGATDHLGWKPASVGGAPSERLLFRQLAGSELIEVDEVVVQRSGGGSLLFAMSAPKEKASSARAAFDALLASVRFAEPRSPAAPSL